MSGHRNLSYAQLNEAYSWRKDQEGDDRIRLDEEGADQTEVMIRLGNGAYRAPLAKLIDRGPSTPEEEMLRAEEDEPSYEDAFDFSDDEICDDYDIDDLDTALWYERIRRIGDDMDDLDHIELDCASTADRRYAACYGAVDDDIRMEVAVDMYAFAEHDAVDHGPTAISGRRHHRTNDDWDACNWQKPASWKDTTKAPMQFLRHAGRIQSTFRRSQARAA